MNKLTIFVVRALMGALFAFMLTRVFFPEATWITMAEVGILLVFLAYVFDYFRGRRDDTK